MSVIHRINQFPAKFREQAVPVLSGKLDSCSGLRRASRALNLFDEPVIGHSLRPDEPCWFYAGLQPCLFVGAIFGRPGSGYQEFRAAHLSAAFMSQEIEEVLPIAPRAVWFAGMANRSSHSTLSASVDKIVAALRKVGVEISVSWETDERPQLVDQRTGSLISDLGLDIGGLKDLYRQVFFGISSNHSLLISLVARVYDEKATTVNLFTDTVGQT